MTATLTRAVGGERLVPAPDPIARDYLLLALRLDQRSPGLVDAYFGPANLKAQVDMEQLRSPARLADDAATLRDRLAVEVRDGARRRWLDAQLVALETQARALAGTVLPYLDHVERCFDFRPTRRPDDRFRDIARRLDAVVPGAGALPERLNALDDALTVSTEHLSGATDWLVGTFRERARGLFGLPEGESLRVSFVHDQPWSGYNWYDGGLRSRVDINLDLPVRAPDLVRVVAHETYPGHHLEHSWHEADMVAKRGWQEASIQLINAPECLLSEGLADLGYDFAVPPDEEADLLAALADRAGLGLPGDGDADERATLQAEIAHLRREMGDVAVNAAFMRHVDEEPHETVVAYLVDVGLMPPERARKRLSFIEHRLWRTYVFSYSEGSRLLGRWLHSVPRELRAARFGRLLHEELTPGAIIDELGGARSQGAASSRTNTARSSPSPS